MVRSLDVLNLSLGSASTCLFFELTDAEGLFLSLCSVMGTPIGNEIAGRRHDRVSALLSPVLYYHNQLLRYTGEIAYKGHLKCLGGLRVEYLDSTKSLTDPKSRFSRMLIQSIV